VAPRFSIVGILFPKKEEEDDDEVRKGNQASKRKMKGIQQEKSR